MKSFQVLLVIGAVIGWSSALPHNMATSTDSTRTTIEGTPGEPKHIDVHDAILLQTLKSVGRALNARVSYVQYHKLTHVLDATKQVVAGTLYRVRFDYAATKCLSEEVLTDEQADRCEVATGKDSQSSVCFAQIWSRPWLARNDVIEMNCADDRKKLDEIVGAPHRVPVDDRSLLDALRDAEIKMSNAINSPYAHVVTRVIEATSQIVAGVLYDVKFEFGQTKCKKSTSGEVAAECRTNISSSQTCHAKIVSKPWLKSNLLLEFHCENN